VSERLTSIETGEETTLGTPGRVACATCHDVVSTGARAEKPEELEAFHRGLQVTHGNLACTSCHATGDPTALHLATGEKLAMSEALRLCSQCHGPQRTSFDHNAHGGLNGYWDLSRGPRLKNHCVDCHDPHAPAIGQVVPVLEPKDRGGQVEGKH